MTTFMRRLPPAHTRSTTSIEDHELDTARSSNDYDVHLEDLSPVQSNEEDRLNVTTQLLPTTPRKQAIVLITSFLTVFQTIGINQGYGVFQDYYSRPNEMLSNSENPNRALIAFVGTLGAGLTWGGSIFVNPLMARSPDRRWVTVTGALLMGLGYAIAGQCTEVWQLLLTQGLIYGIGSSMLYFPAVGVAPEYFDAHRGAAMGIILSAAGIGGLVMAPCIRAMLSHIGPRWTLRALAIINLAVGVPVAFYIAPSRSKTRRPTLVNLSLAKKPAFILQGIAALLQASGNFVPLTFLPEFSTALGYTAAFGAVLLSINNGINAASRVLMGVAADKVGRQNTLVLSVLGSAICVLVFWMGAALDGGTRSLWLCFVVLYGILAGGFNALFPTTITEVFGIQAYASVNGFLYFVRGCGAFFGSPVGGAILGDSRVPEQVGQETGQILSDYRKLIWYDGALLLGSSLCVIGVRAFDAREKGRWKWKA